MGLAPLARALWGAGGHVHGGASAFCSDACPVRGLPAPRLPAHRCLCCLRWRRTEFQRHKDADAEFVGPFFEEWERYVDQLETQAMGMGGEGFGADLEAESARALSEEQQEQLLKLRQASLEAAAASDASDRS